MPESEKGENLEAWGKQKPALWQVLEGNFKSF